MSKRRKKRRRKKRAPRWRVFLGFAPRGEERWLPDDERHFGAGGVLQLDSDLEPSDPDPHG